MIDVLIIAYILIAFSTVMQRYKESNKTVSFRMRRSRPHILPCLCILGAAIGICLASYLMNDSHRYIAKNLIFHGIICGAPLFVQLFVPLKKGSGIEARIREYRRTRGSSPEPGIIHAGIAIDATEPNSVKIDVNDQKTHDIETYISSSSSPAITTSPSLDEDTEDEYIAAANIPNSLGITTENLEAVLPINISLSIVLGIIIVLKWRQSHLNELPLLVIFKAAFVLLFYSVTDTMLFCSYVHRTLDFLFGYVPAIVVSSFSQALCCYLCFYNEEAKPSFWMFLLSSFATQAVFGSSMGNTFSVWPTFVFFNLLGAGVIESNAKGSVMCLALANNGFGMAVLGALFFGFCCAGLTFWVLQIHKKQRMQKTPLNPLTSFFSSMREFKFHIQRKK